MRLDRHRKIVLAASGTALVALGGTAWWILRPRPPGKLLCPASRLVDAEDLKTGSFVVLELASIDGSFAEPTWGRIVRKRLIGGYRIELVGETSDEGDPIPLSTARHGYAIGQTITVDPSCMWDVYRPPTGTAELVCGPALATLPEGLPKAPDADAVRLRRGDDAAVVIAAEGKPTEIVWLRIESASPGSQSFTGRVLQPTLHPEIHGINQNDPLEFVRDCVVDVRIGGGM